MAKATTTSSVRAIRFCAAPPSGRSDQMTACIARRQFIALLGGAGVAWPPLVARAQQPTTPVVGFVNPAAPETIVRYVAAFRKGLTDHGRGCMIQTSLAKRIALA